MEWAEHKYFFLVMDLLRKNISSKLQRSLLN